MDGSRGSCWCTAPWQQHRWWTEGCNYSQRVGKGAAISIRPILLIWFFSPTFLQEMKLMQNSVNGHWVYFSRLFNHALLTVVSNEVLPICSRNWLLRGWSKDFSCFLRESRRCCSPSSGWLIPWSLTCCESRPSESPTWCAGASPRTTETRRWMHFPAALVLQSSSVKFLKFFCRVFLFLFIFLHSILNTVRWD